ncbi:MAG: site-specific integrase [Halobacteriota archaeon]
MTNKVVEAAYTRSMRDYLLMKVLWQTGIRVDELLQIRPRDLEYHNERINIFKAKGNKQRRVPVKRETLEQLQAYIKDKGIAADSPLFQNRHGKAYTQQWVRKIVRRYGSLISRDVHPHTFRHSFAINSVRQGVDIRRLQQVLGYSNINITAVYLQFNDKDVQEAYANVQF